MKISRKAEQKNFVIERSRYTDSELKEMLERKEIFYFGKDYRDTYTIEDWELRDVQFRIFTDCLASVQVELNDGFYVATATGENGKKYFVEI